VGQPGSTQVHDFNPGVGADGLFWTLPIPRESVDIDLDDATARFHMEHLAIPDFFDFLNAVGASSPPVPPAHGAVSFDVRWQGTKPLAHLRDAVNGFVGDFMHSQATIAWSAEEPSRHFRFVSDGAEKSTTISGVIGRERNGAFFS
jgi:hypothetical protein